MSNTTPPLLKARSKDPLDSAWRSHMKAGQWVPDISVTACMICRGTFSFWTRKHHCRRCGAVVCDGCSGNRTRFIYKEITASHVADEDCRVCDLCIQVVDEKLAFGLSQRFGKAAARAASEEADEQWEEQEASFLKQSKSMAAEPRSNRGVLTVGRYRAEIKESEGNRYIRDNDL